ncbi:uncharacterized protein EI90DRAFT_2918099 [Cantharellus anzutake]|uniref:uncharacterized protein n=1 Tax=Cantharellus anzutake TaxID=1750568 RepID=UPI0019060997|nr:uncharacterized protein EI90DRAFT_2918099 [Cantharellus anzutake]KAF8332763.1 hypothetical protein EI90DRAFT_2918099 [Cantharellus anzutake]
MATSEHSLTLDALEHEIEKVTVYNDRAAVTRRFRVDFKVGQNEISIGRLPKVLESDSIRVETETASSSQALTVFDVIYVAPQLGGDSSQSDPFKGLEDKRAVLQNKLDIIQRQSNLLSSYAEGLNDKVKKVEQLESFLEMYSTRSEKSHALKQELSNELAGLTLELQERREQSNSEHEARKFAGVNVVILAEEEGPADVILSYIVTAASWKSLYDVRADVGSQIASSQSGSPTITLQYRASISQATGEDWMGVALTLSTASPLVASEIPDLQPWTIGPPPPPPPIPSPSYGGRVGWKRSAMRLSSNDSPMPILTPVAEEACSEVWSNNELILPGTFKSKVVVARASEGAVSSSFEVEGRSTIPNDNSSHKVSIVTLELASTLQWVTVPRKAASAFLQCRIKNTSNYMLIAGPSSVFMDGNFVSKSTIPDVSPQESFSCSLGVDPSVKITYHPQTKLVRSQGGSFFSALPKQQITKFVQRITVKNTRPSSLSRLTVRDQVPNSEDSRIKVTMLQPDERYIGGPAQGYTTGKYNQTSSSDAGTLSCTIRKGVVAQWAQRKEDDFGGTGGARGDGVIEWLCSDVESSLDLELEYEVSSPMTFAGRRFKLGGGWQIHLLAVLVALWQESYPDVYFCTALLWWSIHVRTGDSGVQLRYNSW